MESMEIKEDTNCSFNDDEVFFGRLTLKEVKKRIFMDVHQKYKSKLANCNENDNDFKLIETRSQPNMILGLGDGVELTDENLKSTSDPLFNRDKHIESKRQSVSDYESQDSFLDIEKNVTELCKSPYNSKNLDNTLEFVDFVLKHAPSDNNENTGNKITKQEDNKQHARDCTDNSILKEENLYPNTINNQEKFNEGPNNMKKSLYQPSTPIKLDQTDTVVNSINFKPKTVGPFNTPISNKKEASNLFKTPKIPLSGRKELSGKKTPSRSKAYEHIASPIATYIRNCPQVPLVKDVHPKKPLPSTSLIPKLQKNVSDNKIDKENIMLPQLAYRNAKKTLVIDVSKEKLPQSNWAQKLTSVPQKPVVLKHNHREAGKKPLSQQEDSFQDLSLHQADISVCTQKLAFHKH